MGRFNIRVDKPYFDFAAAHFSLFSDRTREPLHGHNYRCYVEIEGGLNADSMVLNYVHIKPLTKRICDEVNHKVLLPLNARDLKVVVDGNQVLAEHVDGSRFSFPKQDCVLLDVPNTSTEMISVHVARRIATELRKGGHAEGLTQLRVGIEEAPGQMSWYESAFGEL
ncbi:MAG: 6-carboxytetrahydropterin synthase [Planctomycetes bacterium]|nr:6-carboxytetrahydropterin synthase [Planctomycetota bacterium]NUQ35319.1 6-carboxytetrahydropterin synthase [Planctomycetaceae bacterium]